MLIPGAGTFLLLPLYGCTAATDLFAKLPLHNRGIIICELHRTTTVKLIKKTFRNRPSRGLLFAMQWKLCLVLSYPE